MHATVCLLRAGQPRRAGAAAKSGEFVGQFSWVTGDPIVLKGLIVVGTLELLPKNRDNPKELVWSADSK